MCWSERMFRTIKVKDLKGRDWLVARRFAPWWPWLQPVGVALGRYRRRRAVPVEDVPDQSKADAPDGLGDWVLKGVIIVIFALPEVLGVAVGRALAAVFLTPFAVLETLARAVAGAVALPLRLAGVVRFRVEVVGHDRHRVHYLAVLLVRGRRAADALVESAARELTESKRRFDPGGLPAHVTVRSQQTVWY
jgi:hypothetical protein